MLPAAGGEAESVRLATTDDYDRYFISPDFKASAVNQEQALEENFFLGLRLNRGVNLERVREEFGEAVDKFGEIIDELVADGLLIRSEKNLRLTNHGRLLSNEVFGRFIGVEKSIVSHTKGPSDLLPR
jgi:oxygen-independent coproporphyrinogen-3 oxidase